MINSESSNTSLKEMLDLLKELALKIYGADYNEKEIAKDYQYYLIRSSTAGVFAANLVGSQESNSLELRNARRIWYWEGAASLSEMSVRGVKNPENCKFPIAIESMRVFDVIEIIPCTKEAELSIKNVPEWKA